MSTPISQREAHRLRKPWSWRTSRRNAGNRWRVDYPGGVHIATLDLSDVTVAQLDTARKLGFALIAKLDGSGVRIHAVKP